MINCRRRSRRFRRSRPVVGRGTNVSVVDEISRRPRGIVRTDNNNIIIIRHENAFRRVEQPVGLRSKSKVRVRFIFVYTAIHIKYCMYKYTPTRATVRTAFSPKNKKKKKFRNVSDVVFVGAADPSENTRHRMTVDESRSEEKKKLKIKNTTSRAVLTRVSVVRRHEKSWLSEFRNFR